MKKLITVCVLSLILSGCDFIPQFYDNNEYLILSEIESSSRLLYDECVDIHGDVIPRIETLYEVSETFRTYTFYQPQNETTTEQAAIIANNISELRLRYRQSEPSEAYCQLKAEAVKMAAQRVLSTIGNKARK